MTIRGMSLIELLVAMAVASLVAAMAATALSIAGVAAARHSVARRQDDAAWLALAAMARDLTAAEVWTGCTGHSDCAARPAHPAASALVVSSAVHSNLDLVRIVLFLVTSRARDRAARRGDPPQSRINVWLRMIVSHHQPQPHICR